MKRAFSSLFSVPSILRVLGVLTLAVSLLGPSVQAATQNWQNSGTDFNTAGNWSSGVPGPADTARFNSAMGTQPNLSASLTINNLNFTSAGVGYDLRSSNTGIKLTLMRTGTGGASAIDAVNTSGTNTIDAPLILGAAANQTQTFTQSSGGTLIVNGVISSTNNVTLSLDGGGLIQLSGANTYSGGTTLVNGTTVRINNATALGTGTFTINSGTIDNTTAGAITLSNNNAQAWNGDFTFTGTRSLNLGTGAVTLGASRTVTVNANNLTVGGVISGSGFGLTKAGNGTLTLGGANTYSGGTTLSAGTLNVNNAKALGTGTFTISGGTIDNTTAGAITLSNNNAQAWNGDFTFTGTQSLNLGTGAVALGASRTVTVNANNLTVGGVISGTGFGLTKAGNGTLTLSGANTYTGATTVNAGTLLINGNNSAATGAVSVNNSGTTLGGTGTIGGAVTVGNGAILLGGTGSTASGTLTLAKNLTLNSGSIIELALGASGAHSTLARTGGTWLFGATQAFTFINLGAQPGLYDNIITGLASDPMSEGNWTITDAGWVGTFSWDG